MQILFPHRLMNGSTIILTQEKYQRIFWRVWNWRHPTQVATSSPPVRPLNFSSAWIQSVGDKLFSVCVKLGRLLSSASWPMAINTDVENWGGGGSINSGERAWLLQSPSVDSEQLLEADRRRSGGVSLLGAVFIVVNAALGAGLLNFPAAFNMAGGVTAGVMLQMVRTSK